MGQAKRNRVHLGAFFALAVRRVIGQFNLPIPGRYHMPVHLPTKVEADNALRPVWHRRKRELARTRLHHANAR